MRRKLLHLLILLALTACAPTLGPASSPLAATAAATATAAPIAAGPTPTHPAPASARPAAIITLPPTIGPPSPTVPPAGPASPASSATSATPQWGNQTKTAGCLVQGAFPDPACTTGDIFPGVTAAQVCVSGYSAGVRDVPASEKDTVYGEYGIVSHSTGQYEVDHFVSLELGGSNDISNLFPEAANPTPGFHQKDLVENYLHAQVCQGVITLAVAQVEIATNWLAVYQSLPGGSAPLPSPTRARVIATPAPAQRTPTPSQVAAPSATAAPAATIAPTAAGARARVGALCNDGTSSTAKGSGACSGHGGVKCWKYSDGTCTKP